MVRIIFLIVYVQMRNITVRVEGRLYIINKSRQIIIIIIIKIKAHRFREWQSIPQLWSICRDETINFYKMRSIGLDQGPTSLDGGQACNFRPNFYLIKLQLYIYISGILFRRREAMGSECRSVLVYPLSGLLKIGTRKTGNVR
jgi:hypothetical protein